MSSCGRLYGRFDLAHMGNVGLAIFAIESSVLDGDLNIA